MFKFFQQPKVEAKKPDIEAGPVQDNANEHEMVFEKAKNAIDAVSLERYFEPKQ